MAVPDVRGAGLPEARAALQTLGLQADEKDARGNRWIMSANNWTVHDQTPAPGGLISTAGRVTLLCLNAEDTPE